MNKHAKLISDDANVPDGEHLIDPPTIQMSGWRLSGYATNGSIVYIYDSDRRCIMQAWDWPNSMAIARLAVAAPDLLAAATFALDWLESFNIPPQSTPDERDEVRAILRAAIVKAEASS